MIKRSDIEVGMRFGFYEVISLETKICYGDKLGIHVKCISCNKETYIPLCFLKNYSSNSKGCKQCSTFNHWKSQYCGDISIGFFNNLKKSAQQRGVEFDLTHQYLWDLYQKQLGECTLTRLPIEFNKGFSDKCSRTASLDRIDSSKGYVVDNVQWIHKDINFMKGNFSEKYFIKMCECVYKISQLSNKFQRWEVIDDSFLLTEDRKQKRVVI